MREGGVAALAFPFPTPQSEEILAVWAFSLQRNRRHEWAGIMLTREKASALECVLQECCLFIGGIEEQAGRGVAVIRGDNKPPAIRKPLDKGPKIVARKLRRDVPGEDIKPLTCACAVVQLSVRPLVPKNPVWRSINEITAILPRQIDTFGTSGSKAIQKTTTIVLELATAVEAQRL